MTVSIMQSYLFPYLGYYQLINAADKFVVLDDVNFIKRGHINRNQILLNNTAHLFSLPLIKASQNKLICDTYITEDKSELDKLSSKIQRAYKKAPFYDTIFPLIDSCIHFDNSNLAEYVVNSITSICDYLEIDTKIIPSSRIYDKGDLKGQMRILDIVKKEKADSYINPIGGLEIYDKSLFANEGIELKFHKMEDVNYPQFSNDFIPHLSIIDVMMFNSVEEIKQMLTKFQLV